MPTLTPPSRGYGMVPVNWVQRLLADGRPGNDIRGLWHFKMAYFLAARSQRGKCLQSRERLFAGIATDTNAPSRSSLMRGLQALGRTGLVLGTEAEGGPRSKVLTWTLFEQPVSSPARHIWRQHTDSEWFREASPNTIRVLWALTLHRTEDMKAGRLSTFTSVKRLADEAGLSKRTVQTHLRHLEAAGVIETHAPRPGWKTPSRYWAFPSRPRRAADAKPETLMFSTGQAWKELTVDAIADHLQASPGLVSWCVEKDGREVKPANEWPKVQEAMEARVRERYGRS